MKSKNKNKPYITIIIVLTLLTIGFCESQRDKEKLIDFNITNGTIIKIQDRSQRGYFIRYTYTVSNKQYFNNQKLSIKRELISIGDIFEVKYSNEDNSVSKLNFKKRINNE